MSNLVLLRHGQSVWNRENRFTGWEDVDLTAQGMREAHQAGVYLRSEGLAFSRAYTSLLKRAIRTLWVALDELNQMWLPVEKTWRLNERHYGALQGLEKSETATRFGKAQVFQWRRSYATPPPLLSVDDLRHPRHDPRYHDLNPDDLPGGESLQDTLRRVLPYWQEEILPRLIEGEDVLVVAHGNSLRALVKYLEDIPDQDTPGLSIPTGIPMLYTFGAAMRPSPCRFLGDTQVVEEARQAAAQAAQVKAKSASADTDKG